MGETMTRTRWGVAAAVVFLLALGSSPASSALGLTIENQARLSKADSAKGESPGAASFKEGVVLADSQFALEKGPGATRFNFARLRDLWVRVNLAGMPHLVQLNLSLTGPQGTLVYEASVPFSLDPRMTTMDSPGAGHRVTVFQAKPLRGGLALDYALPVSGSVVTRYLNAGTWKLMAEVGERTFSTSIDVSTDY
jgi:hypothetical protein